MQAPSTISAAPDWAVPVSASFPSLVLAGIGVAKAWKVSRGARVSPFEQSNILHRVKVGRWKLWVLRDFITNVVTLPVALWGVH